MTNAYARSQRSYDSSRRSNSKCSSVGRPNSRHERKSLGQGPGKGYSNQSDHYGVMYGLGSWLMISGSDPWSPARNPPFVPVNVPAPTTQSSVERLAGEVASIVKQFESGRSKDDTGAHNKPTFHGARDGLKEHRRRPTLLNHTTQQSRKAQAKTSSSLASKVKDLSQRSDSNCAAVHPDSNALLGRFRDLSIDKPLYNEADTILQLRSEKQNASKLRLIADIIQDARLGCPFAKADPEFHLKCLPINRKNLHGIKLHLGRIHYGGKIPSVIHACSTWSEIFKICVTNTNLPLPAPSFDFRYLLQRAIRLRDQKEPIQSGPKLENRTSRETPSGEHNTSKVPSAQSYHSHQIEEHDDDFAEKRVRSHVAQEPSMDGHKPLGHERELPTPPITPRTTFINPEGGLLFNPRASKLVEEEDDDDISEELSALWVLEHLGVCLVSAPTAMQWFHQVHGCHAPCDGGNTNASGRGGKRTAAQVTKSNKVSHSSTPNNSARNHPTRQNQDRGDEEEEDERPQPKRRRQNLPILQRELLCPCAVTKCENHQSCWVSRPKWRQNLSGIREHLKKDHFEKMGKSFPEELTNDMAKDWQDIFQANLVYCPSNLTGRSQKICYVVYVDQAKKHLKDAILYTPSRAKELVKSGDARFENESDEFTWNPEPSDLETTPTDVSTVASEEEESSSPADMDENIHPSVLSPIPESGPQPSRNFDPLGVDVPQPESPVNSRLRYPQNDSLQDASPHFNTQGWTNTLDQSAPQLPHQLDTSSGLTEYQSHESPLLMEYFQYPMRLSLNTSNDGEVTTADDGLTSSQYLRHADALVSPTRGVAASSPAFLSPPAFLSSPATSADVGATPLPFQAGTPITPLPFRVGTPTSSDFQSTRPSSSAVRSSRTSSTPRTQRTGVTSFFADQDAQMYRGSYKVMVERKPALPLSSEERGWRPLEFDTLVSAELDFEEKMRQEFHDPKFNWDEWQLEKTETGLLVNSAKEVIEELKCDPRRDRTSRFYLVKKSF